MSFWKNKLLIVGILCCATGAFASKVQITNQQGQSDFASQIQATQQMSQSQKVQAFYDSAAEACEGKSVDAECTILFPGGELTIGICIELPDSSPAGGHLSCKIDPSQIPSCNNNATGTPGMIGLFMAALGGLFFWRRRKASEV